MSTVLKLGEKSDFQPPSQREQLLWCSSRAKNQSIYLWKLRGSPISQGAPLSSRNHELMLWNWRVLCFMSDFSQITVFSLIFYWELTDCSLILQKNTWANNEQELFEVVFSLLNYIYNKSKETLPFLRMSHDALHNRDIWI